MKKERQIEEMARVIAEVQYLGGLEQKVAQILFEKGYRKQSEWISVDERMPETTDKMLVYDSEGYVYVGTYMRGCWGGTWITPVMGGGPITHWMPLPEPPKMKGGAE